MADAFIGEIRAFPYSFIPEGWLLCDGSLWQIQQFAPLASILGTRFGGDGKKTFGLPNLMGKAVAGAGQGPGLSPVQFGKAIGTTGETITTATMANHDHDLQTQGSATRLTGPGNTALPLNPQYKASDGKTYSYFMYQKTNPTPNAAMAGASVGAVGSGQSHNNLSPYLVFNYCINWNGLYPVNPG